MTDAPPRTDDVVATHEQAAWSPREPLIVLEPLEAFLDAAGVGAGAPTAEPLGDGHSNVTYAIDRGDDRFVLRRPPRGPLAPSTHDVLREARLLTALERAGVRVPEIVATCDDDAVIGAPFYVMRRIDGHVLTTELPADFSRPADPGAIAWQLVDGLVELHAVDIDATGIGEFGRRDGYLERQIRRFRGLLEGNAARPLPELHELADWLDATRPAGGGLSIVHGDYRLGNMMYAAEPGTRLVAVLDWEMATLGDPLADVGYMTATWADPGDADDPMLDLSAVTRLSGFPGRLALAERYAQRSGRDLSNLRWYQTLALWKSAIFLESSYQRFLAGSTDDAFFGRLEAGVPMLARRAARLAWEG
ncbi:phosphotransferase family protein [Capillimicrobium parvum]|uniref:Aminoglycoside phosphotransferase domain-containing protein n=1 Tax=Capillimicrobium parvum TaxID=2884022 RepID=A0A9E7C187_9ACTN|nr:phosphotransferase family protein [Capillimicrobium parvum]UGS37230.1 hypothetical protein DSM104329_03645 [Capillimicrobium parvum]